MTRETKVGLLVGMGIILLIGIVVSDHLSKVQQQQPANFTDMSRETFDSLITNNHNNTLPNSVPVATPARAAVMDRSEPLPLPNEVITPVAPGNRMAEETARYTTPPAPASSYNPTPIEPSRIPEAQPPIQPRNTIRRVEDMSEEQAVANGNTPSRITPPMAVRIDNPQPSTTGTYHTVINGDNLYAIAQRYYGNGDQWRLIRDANPRLVLDNGAIMLGSRLLIPSKQQIQRNNNDATLTGNTNTVVREITVESGDTLSELARKHLGSAADWDELLKANRDKITRPEELRVGMTLRLPAKAIARQQVQQPTVTGNTRQPSPATNTTGPKTYTIESGDTLSSIAAKTMGSANKWYKLYQHNKSTINDPDNLTVGTTIKIPG